MFPSKTAVIRSVAALRAHLAAARASGRRIALVPTMGALHAGHLSLVEAGKREADLVVLSIFVNPTQFAPSEDFDAYPRSFDADVALFEAAGGDVVFAPGVDDMYPDGFSTTVLPEGPAKAGLEDRFRPAHFAGVATVVAKLLNQCRPDVAMFGEKDFQQLKVVTRMARDLDIEARIRGVATMRESDGLAMSSRNRYLTPAERAVAPRLHAILQDVGTASQTSEEPVAAAATGQGALERAGFAPDYVEARHAETLQPATADGPIRLLAAARLGATRLIDNIAASGG